MNDPIDSPKENDNPEIQKYESIIPKDGQANIDEDEIVEKKPKPKIKPKNKIASKKEEKKVDEESDTETEESENAETVTDKKKKGKKSKEENENVAEVKVTEEFTTNVKELVRIDNEIHKLRTKIKELAQEKRPLEEFILDNLAKLGIQSIDISDGKLIANKYKTKAPLKKEHIQEELKKEFRDASKAASVADRILTERPMVERVNLKRTHKHAE